MTQMTLVECHTCKLVYDSSRIPECPRRADRRRGSAFEVFSKTRSGRVRTGPPSGRAAIQAIENGLTIIPSAAFGAATGQQREQATATAIASSHRLTPAYFVIAFLAGCVLHQIAVNWAVGLPWNDAPVAIFHAPQPYRVAARSSSVHSTPAVPSPASPGSGAMAEANLRVTSVRFDNLSDDGMLTWIGRVVNPSSADMMAVSVSVRAQNADGATVADGLVQLDPEVLGAGDSRVVQVRIKDDPSIDRLVIGGSWMRPRHEEALYTEIKPGDLDANPRS